MNLDKYFESIENEDRVGEELQTVNEVKEAAKVEARVLRQAIETTDEPVGNPTKANFFEIQQILEKKYGKDWGKVEKKKKRRRKKRNGKK